MRRVALLCIVLLLVLMFPCTERSAAASTGKTVGIDIAFEDITDFFYTYDASTAPPHYQRYRFFAEDGKHYFYHETREGGGWHTWRLEQDLHLVKKENRWLITLAEASTY